MRFNSDIAAVSLNAANDSATVRAGFSSASLSIFYSSIVSESSKLSKKKNPSWSSDSIGI
jgi:hypothetical protein